MPDFPTSFQELRKRWAMSGAVVEEQPVPKLVGPDLPTNAVIPAHRGAKATVRMGEQSKKRLWPEL